MSGRSTIELDVYLPAPATRVWRALTDSDLLARWLMPNDLTPHVGRRFTIDAGERGITACEVLEVTPERLLRFSWRNGPLDTVVTWRLEPDGAGTRLFLTHTGFDADDAGAFDAMSGGWGAMMAGQLTRVLKEMAAVGE